MLYTSEGPRRVYNVFILQVVWGWVGLVEIFVKGAGHRIQLARFFCFYLGVCGFYFLQTWWCNCLL